MAFDEWEGIPWHLELRDYAQVMAALETAFDRFYALANQRILEKLSKEDHSQIAGTLDCILHCEHYLFRQKLRGRLCID